VHLFDHAFTIFRMSSVSVEVLVEFASNEISLLETAGVATVCINKNTEIAMPFSVSVQAMDITATGNCFN